MVDLTQTENHPDAQFYDILDEVPAGMLHLENTPLHSQPMAATREQGTNTLWFFAKTDSELVQEMRKGNSTAHFVVVGKNHDFHACVNGYIRENLDTAKRDEYWNPVVAAWYEGGKEDPTLTLLQMDLETGSIWGSTGSSVKFGWEIAKANLMDEKTPDVGVHRTVKFR
ncbi:pyridoxamine 5'-phosphate oxidase family protein [Parvularcula sp. ZS-1/3]|uniref:Pyridoxamine 5'-phosphate oxidase family protein n=1 Tax=Parvularcula mediterranea TaxID=2732508 RepID=A0A7Y3W4I7_9PROT|nr:pyridoxamine 5'-phosphate oxidase family protein [Parvularcula mediterranea]NNU15307.1 pyridoxamine 5'-phosphate oxidase family protein [Parvularcula mediterranea]